MINLHVLLKVRLKHIFTDSETLGLKHIFTNSEIPFGLEAEKNQAPWQDKALFDCLF